LGDLEWPDVGHSEDLMGRSPTWNDACVILSGAKDLGLGVHPKPEILRSAQDDTRMGG
jgi:hypothetical protein